MELPAIDFGGARPYIKTALEYAGNTHTLDDVAEGVREGRFQYWPSESGRSAIVTEVLEAPRQRTLHFFLAGGDLQELEQMHERLLEWGRAVGCTRATLAGRPGWARSFLTRAGWRPSALLMETEL